MDQEAFERICGGYILKGDLIGAMDYIKQAPELVGLYQRCVDLFERENYLTYEVDADLNELLTLYQRYYRDAFYLRLGKEEAAERLRRRLADRLGLDREEAELDAMEENQVARAFESRGFHFLGGLTSGYYGPYIWRTTETKTYQVELPEGVQTYTVRLLDGFISKSWVDYLSFGRNGTGGWTDADGVINCVRSAYDFDSEAFKVSLLKHEAQHARDLARDRDMSSEELEYRAKLVELIYSEERDLLGRFLHAADSADKSNGHAAAASRIVEGFLRKLDLRSPQELEGLSNRQIRETAGELFEESSRELRARTGGAACAP